jgi:23S rRNA pseudouridine2605 synthase
METSEGSEIRLQRILAGAGVGSRRYCEELIAEGRVSIDGVTVDRQGVRVDPSAHVIRVDGERVVSETGHHYVMLNKPAGVVSTMFDELGRPAVGDAVRRPGLFHVGRLDAATEGLLLLTNDGELAHRLMHPSYGVPKVYLAEVEGRLVGAERRLLLTGVTLEDGPAKADRVRIVGQAAARTSVQIEVHEGRNRLVRRMFESVGHPVRQLVRVRYGPIDLGTLRSGRTRPLSQQEVGQLYNAVDM